MSPAVTVKCDGSGCGRPMCWRCRKVAERLAIGESERAQAARKRADHEARVFRNAEKRKAAKLAELDRIAAEMREERAIMLERQAAERRERQRADLEADHWDEPSAWASHMGAGNVKRHRYAIPRAA